MTIEASTVSIISKQKKKKRETVRPEVMTAHQMYKASCREMFCIQSRPNKQSRMMKVQIQTVFFFFAYRLCTEPRDEAIPTAWYRSKTFAEFTLWLPSSSVLTAV